MRTVLLIVLFIITAPVSIPVGILYLVFIRAPRAVKAGVQSGVRQYQGNDAQLTREEWEAERRHERRTVAEWKAAEKPEVRRPVTPAEQYWATHSARDD